MIRSRLALVFIVCASLICHFTEPLAKPKRLFQVEQRANWGNFSPDGALFWTSSSESTYVRHTKNGKVLFEIPEPIKTLRVLRAGKRFLIKRAQKSFEILDRKGEVVAELASDCWPVRVTPDGNFILTQRRIDGSRPAHEFELVSSMDGAASWKVSQTGKCLSSDGSRDGKLLALAVHDWNTNQDCLTVINVKSGKIISETMRKERIGEVRFSPDGRYVATKWRANSNARYVDVLDLKTGKVVAVLGKDLPVGAPVWSGDGKLLGVTNYRRPASVQLYSTKDWQPHLDPFSHFRPWRFQFSGDGSIFLTWEWDKECKNSTGILRSSVDGSEQARMTLSDAGYFHLSPDGAIAVEAAGRIAERENVDLLARQNGVWTQHKLPGPLRSAQLDPSGRKLLVLHGPKGATMWDLSKIADKLGWGEEFQILGDAL